ncbi:MAG: HIT family protein [Elusimicrobia bacterium]|jgi:ATP adenylyltransferase|nr:HIT family protein [Elusimicrobiota bacterium]
MEDCVFCNIKKTKKFIIENKWAFAVKDSYPVTKGHTLIISKRHESDFFNLPEEEKTEALKLVVKMKERLLLKDANIDGFNIGINIGRASGQTVPHVHIHIIPRRRGDCKDPTGGVRGVIPEKQAY